MLRGEHPHYRAEMVQDRSSSYNPVYRLHIDPRE